MLKKGQVFFVASAGLALLSGCVQSPPDGKDVLKVPVPQDWSTDGVAGILSQDWVNDLRDDKLKGFIDEALAGNFQLQASLARLDQALALARIEGADRWPGVSIGANAQRSDNNGPFDPSNNFSVTGTANWELDLWGRVRAQAGAGTADAFAADADYRAAQLSLAVRIAQAWFNAITEHQKEILSLETLTSFEANLTTVDERFRRGLSPALDLRLTRANVATTRATYNQQQRLKDAAIRQLEVLLGRYPSGAMQVSDNLPVLDNTIPAGLPSELLNRRPDLLAAEQRVRAADLRLQDSKLSLLPAINLTARLGRASSELDNLLEGSYDIWSLIGSLTAPVFQGGRLRANVDRSEARLREAVASYQGTVLVAFREVESALVDEVLLREQLAAVQLSAEESIGAQQLAEERYQRGLVDIITVLESQRRAFNARSTLLNIQNQLLQNRLSLYLALGGGI